MIETEFANELPQRAEQALGHLRRLMQDLTGKARDTDSRQRSTRTVATQYEAASV
jgi:hypothetical protein